jgi:acetyl-CoA carboxylase carboxyltransferase component
MSKGGFHETFFTASWPTGEFGGMGLEGAVKAGFRKELEAVEDETEREALYNKLVALAYERGKAINMASYLEIDSVIDPADTRKWIMQGLRSVPAEHRPKIRHSFVDPW